MSERWPGGLITKNPVVPDGESAPGIWTLDQAEYFIQANLWPVPNNYWISSLDTANVADAIGDIAVDGAGNVYVCGYTTSQNRAYIAKYNADGVLQWQKTLSAASTNDSVFNSISAANSGNVYATGYARVGSVYYALLAKYDSSGNLIWQRIHGGGSENLIGMRSVIDSNENIYGTCTANGTYSYTIHLAKFDSSGGIIWQRSSSTFYDGIVQNIYLDVDGNIYLSGRYNAGGNYPAWLAKFGSTGGIIWSRRYDAGGGGGTVGMIWDMAVSQGTVYAATQAPSASGGNGAMIGRFSASDGSLIGFTVLAFNNSNTWARSISFDSSGSNFYMVGRVSGSKMLIAKYSSDMSLQWQREISSSVNVDGVSAIYNKGVLYIGGSSSTSSGAILSLKLRSGNPQVGSYSVGGITYTISTPEYSSGSISYSPVNAGVTNYATSYTSSSGSLTEATGTLVSSTAQIP